LAVDNPTLVLNKKGESPKKQKYGKEKESGQESAEEKSQKEQEEIKTLANHPLRGWFLFISVL